MNLRRHKNRTLYDLDTGKPVTLIQVSRALRDAEVVVVTAAGTEKDCTAQVLLQILTFEARRGREVPLPPLIDAFLRTRTGVPSSKLSQLTKQLVKKQREG